MKEKKKFIQKEQIQYGEKDDLCFIFATQ